MARLQQLLREPLLHFLLIGAVLFLIYGWLNPGGGSGDRQRIEITPAVVDRLEESWTSQWRRPPDPEELASLIDAYIREEIFYREALALGLDNDDSIIRRRLAQKMEFLTEDVITQAPVTVAELRDFFAANREQFAEPARVSFVHLYFSPDRRGGEARNDAQLALDELRAAGTVDAGERGDPFLMQSDYRGLSQRDAAQLFGASFAEALFALPPGEWQGPIESGFGWHLVRVLDRQETRIPDFEAVRDRVEQEFNYQRYRAVQDDVYQRLRSQYDIVLPPIEPAS